MPYDIGRSKFRMGRLDNGVWYCKHDERPKWSTAGEHTPSAKKKFSITNPDQDCGFFLWEENRADAEDEMRNRTGGGEQSSRKRTAHAAELEGDRPGVNGNGNGNGSGSSSRQRRAGTTPTPGPSRLNLPGLPRRDAEPDGGDNSSSNSSNSTVFDAIIGILEDEKTEVSRVARLRIQAELLDQTHALEEAAQRIRHLREKVACLVALSKGSAGENGG
ncbi:unnamed protein product [Discula destructiva]